MSRGANVNARSSLGGTCLHVACNPMVDSEDHRSYEIRWQGRLSQAKDILILMISAGADVCAVDNFGGSVSDLALAAGLETVWIEALKYCGIAIKDVLARSNTDPAYSSALDSRYSQPSESLKSKISFKEYLERRKAFEALQDEVDRELEDYAWLASSEDDDSEDDDLAEEPSDDNYDQDEDLAEKSIENANADDKVDTGESGNPHIKHEGRIFKGKAKLE